MVPSGGAAGGVRASDGGIKFVVDLETQEDVVLSCYHVEPRGTSPGSRWKRVFMFRAQFYTGFVREHMLRFTRTSLDGTSENEALFPDDFFVEAFFESHPVGNDYRLPSAWKVCVCVCVCVFRGVLPSCLVVVFVCERLDCLRRASDVLDGPLDRPSPVDLCVHVCMHALWWFCLNGITMFFPHVCCH